MKKSLFVRFCLIGVILYIVSSMFSCNTTKKIKYFQDIPDSGQVKTILKAEYTEPVIRPGDLLNISVLTINPLSTSVINSGNLSTGATSASAGGSGASGIFAALSGGTQPLAGYLVNKNGFIDIPVIGKLSTTGYTTFRLRDTIYNRALKYYKDPTVVVRLANFKVSVTGEVLRPGQYIMPDEKESILDAITMAGDLTIFGKRENVLLIRENLDGSKQAHRINLKKSDIMSSPVYYLRQNDIIYVEPRKSKSDATDASQAKYITLAGAILSIILVFAYRNN